MEIWLRYHETKVHVKGGARPYAKFINIVLRNKLHDSSLHSLQWHNNIQSQNGEVSLENAALKPKKRELRSSIYVTCNAKTTVDRNLRDTWKIQQQQLSCCFDNVRRRGRTGLPEFSGCRKYMFLRTQYVSHVRDSCSEVIIFIPIRLTCACSVISDLLQPHGLQPTRLLCPWDFSGKNTGVGCHFSLQGIFLTQGSNPCLLYWQANSLPLSHLGSPVGLFSIQWFIFLEETSEYYLNSRKLEIFCSKET